jgi:hypothetical protein
MDGFKGTGGNTAILLVSPGTRVGDGKDTSAHPSWRKAVVHVTGMKIGSIMSNDALRTYAPDMGAYGNEVR